MVENNLGLFQGDQKRNENKDRKHKNYNKDSGERKQKMDKPKANNFRDETTQCLRRELLVEDAKKWTEYIESSVSYTQLRKFYSEVLSIKARMKEIKDDLKAFQTYDAVIGMLISKANYSKVRSPRNSNEPLFEFFNSFIPKIKSKLDFEDFALFFEAVLGYFSRKN